MKTNYNIKFKNGVNYRGEIDHLIFSITNNNRGSNANIKEFDKALAKLNINTLKQLRKFIKNESFQLHSKENEKNSEQKELLQDMLPSLCLRRSDALMDKLDKLGFNSEIKNQFIILA